MQMNGIWGSIFEVVSDVINEASFLQIDSEQSHPDGAWAKLKDGMSRFRRLQKGMLRLPLGQRSLMNSG